MSLLNPYLWIKLVLNEIIYRPIFNLLLILVALTGGSLGWAIILLTIIVRLILLKPGLAGNDVQKHMTDLQPKLKEIQEKHKDNPQKMTEEMMKVMKQWGNLKNMARWCLMMIIQIPIFLGLFYVVRDISTILETIKAGKEIAAIHYSDIYSFLYLLWIDGNIFTKINPDFFGINLLTHWNLIITILAGILMFLQFKFMSFVNPTSKAPTTQSLPGMPQMPDMTKFMSMMNRMLVGMMMLFVYWMPAAIWLYIITTTLFSLLQYSWQYRLILKTRIFK